MTPLALLAEALTAVAAQARRTAPMAAGIVWGVASIFVLAAIVRGFETTQRKALESIGDSFLLLRANHATTTRGDVRRNAFVQLDGEDMEAARFGAPSVAALSPKANNWFIRAYRGGEATRATAVGVWPEYATICHVPLHPGSRWIDENDVAQELPVCVLGFGVLAELFPDGESWLGEEVVLSFQRGEGEDTVFRRLTVIGALRDEELPGDSFYVSQRRVMFLPFTTWERMSPEGFDFFVMRPRSPAHKQAALAELRAVLSQRHGFDPDETNTLLPYFDALDRKERIERVFGGLQTFLLAVGVLTLLLGAVGVANVVLMSVTARTSEFGLRRALGCKRRWVFAQVFVEATVVCVGSGVLGFLLGSLGLSVMQRVSLPEGFAPPAADGHAALLPGALLLLVSLAAAAWPATRAARLSVVRALHGGQA